MLGLHAVQASHCDGLLQSTGSRARGLTSCGPLALEHRVNSCPDLPRPGVKPKFPALAGKFFLPLSQGSPHNSLHAEFSSPGPIQLEIR